MMASVCSVQHRIIYSNCTCEKTHMMGRDLCLISMLDHFYGYPLYVLLTDSRLGSMVPLFLPVYCTTTAKKAQTRDHSFPLCSLHRFEGPKAFRAFCSWSCCFRSFLWHISRACEEQCSSIFHPPKQNLKRNHFYLIPRRRTFWFHSYKEEHQERPAVWTWANFTWENSSISTRSSAPILER